MYLAEQSKCIHAGPKVNHTSIIEVPCGPPDRTTKVGAIRTNEMAPDHCYTILYLMRCGTGGQCKVSHM